ncbi:hypothetical protein Q7P36_005913 [Cladosporium allicinum]
MRVLMLHGYSQNSETFRAKTRRLKAHLLDTYPGAEFFYPDGPVRLYTGDLIESLDASYSIGSIARTSQQEHHDERSIDFRAWFYRYVPGVVPRGFSESLSYLADYLQMYGPFDGVIAFSQGCVNAIALVSLLEGDFRYKSHVVARERFTELLDFPQAFRDSTHPPLRFALLFSPGLTLGEGWNWLWEDPKLSTPFCRLLGKWDPIVTDDQREIALRVSEGEESMTRVHGGTHSIPIDSGSLEFISSFLTTIMPPEPRQMLTPYEAYLGKDSQRKRIDSVVD